MLSIYHSVCVCVCVVAPQVLDAMSDSTNTSTMANDLDLLYLKGIMESPVVRCTKSVRSRSMTSINRVVCLLVCIRSKRRVWRTCVCRPSGRTTWSCCRRSSRIWTHSNTAPTPQRSWRGSWRSLTSRCGAPNSLKYSWLLGSLKTGPQTFLNLCHQDCRWIRSYLRASINKEEYWTSICVIMCCDEGNTTLMASWYYQLTKA